MGRYEIRSQIGAGGMREVYLARDTTELERKVAVKVLPSDMAADPERWRAWATLEQIIFDAPLLETEARLAEYEAKATAEAAEKERQEAERQERQQRMSSTSANRPPPSGRWE
ncbi:MAG: hypothetical protein H0T45_10140 [Pyrinomonadaceae bacterium]|nr:hypothetical protein [Pyrinomonadaceae bacterium]MDQ3258306.1 hypothetical protein [Acidobacteriota bacterium]